MVGAAQKPVKMPKNTAYGFPNFVHRIPHSPRPFPRRGDAGALRGFSVCMRGGGRVLARPVCPRFVPPFAIP
ncbi:hypothetical protein [Azospirillum doebereinerae]